ncbi:hypothetical protein [Nocardioides sp.]|uniref:hypothetical protein n=1 Tax=Nocardioides sp. TaxID=35761 RepID=UPI00261D26FC|nr:hypothetical protein [Nocardioides sp.]
MSYDRSLTRGPLPASVYWRRRAAVLGVLLLLIIGVARLFGGGGSDNNASVKPAASTTSPAPVVPENVGAPDASLGASAGATTTPSGSATVTPAAPTSPATTLPQTPAALPTPTGRCSDDDVSVSAGIDKAEATRTVAINLTIKTNVSAACLWSFGAQAVQVEITSGSDQIWSTVECPKAIPTQTLTLRRDTPVQVTVNWNSRRSDSTCSDHTQWAVPGYYHAQVAALGGEPSDIQFRLTKPTPVVTTTPSPTATASAKAGTGAKSGTTAPKNPASKGARSEPTGTPVHPD